MTFTPYLISYINISLVYENIIDNMNKNVAEYYAMATLYL